MKNAIRYLALVTFLAPCALNAEGLLNAADLEYQGAIRIPVGTFGESRMGYTEGTFVVSNNGTTAFMVGHSQHQAIAEFSLPGFSKSMSIADLPMAKNIQPFSRFFDRVPSGNPESINRITGMEIVSGKLVVNGVQYYDGDANNTDTTFIINNPDNLSASSVNGFIKLSADSHASGWMTPIPSHYQESLRGDYMFGFASNFAINGRNSMGPSAFSLRMSDVVNGTAGKVVDMTALADYSIDNLLAEDPYNESRKNDLWTEVSAAYVGFIPDGTQTYAVFGTSGGHESGIGYKITQDNGYLCGGPCPYRSDDVYNYYWFFDVDSLESVARGERLAHNVRPYSYGEIEYPFENQGSVPKLIIGADFDSVNQVVYLMLGKADTLQNQYEEAPLLLAYKIIPGNRPSPPSSFGVQ